MPGFLVHVGAQVLCAHAGQAAPTAPNPRVLVSGQPTVLMSTPYAVAGCTMPPPTAGNGPCVTGQWLTGSVRVTSNGQPLVLQAGSSICAPTGTPMMVVATQTRVTAS
jgi:quercetin dioxygenase-like cupin family protein